MKRIYVALILTCIVIAGAMAQNQTTMPPYRRTEPPPCAHELRDELLEGLIQMQIEAIQDSIAANIRNGHSSVFTKRDGWVAFDVWVIEAQAAADYLTAKKAELEGLTP